MVFGTLEYRLPLKRVAFAGPRLSATSVGATTSNTIATTAAATAIAQRKLRPGEQQEAGRTAYTSAATSTAASQ